MRSVWATRATPHDPTRIHPALTSFANECFGTLARLVAYVGVLALLAIAGLHLWSELLTGLASEPAAKAGWSVAARSYPAFAVSQFDLLEKTEAYQILRHPQGGRKDVFRWTTQGEKPVAELEIYRPSGEFNQTGAAFAGIAARMQPAEERELEAAGVIDSKFGAVTLLRHPGAADGARSCLGFIKRLDQPRLQISGWSCQGDALPARRRDRLYSEPADPAHRRKRAETGGIIRPRRAQARQLRRISHIGRTSGLGDLCGKPPAARHALIGAPTKMLVFMQLFLPVPSLL